MKKLLTLILAMILVFSVLPLASLAADSNTGSSAPGLTMSGDYFILDDIEMPYEDVLIKGEGIYAGYEALTSKNGKITFTPTQLAKMNGQLYDLEGVISVPDNVMRYIVDDSYTPTEKELSEITGWLKQSAENGKTSVSIPAFPETADYEDPADYDKAVENWLKKNSGIILAIYGPHQHVLTGWRRDNNNHWSDCRVCKKQFVVINWHSDHDEDDFCDVCGHEIVYYDISIKDVEGVKVTIDGDRDMTAPYRDWIEVSVEAEEGYEVTDVRVWKIRADGTKNQIVRHIVKRGSEYKFEMQNFDCEIVPTVVKK